MSAGNFGSPTQLLILLAIVLLLFGGKRLRNLGGDLGNAIKGFKNSMEPTAKSEENIAHSPPPLLTEKVEVAKEKQPSTY